MSQVYDKNVCKYWIYLWRYQGKRIMLRWLIKISPVSYEYLPAELKSYSVIERVSKLI